MVGPDLVTGTFLKWSGIVEGRDHGFLYVMPFYANSPLRFDPIHHTATLISSDENLHGDGKLDNGVLADNGFIYAILAAADRVLKISPLIFRP